ncbi:hypothetical protein A3I95_00840 [Candidatus Nomurabacteria bacterium RIFCSPLOWO2_02_FULL_44_12]|uniref:Uncharacterized protein n=1 Tax=Candidatus Nomurabacteria bacterium RIFCSPLOWO2_12_FULL_44_11 TaxID=1801796 RepID=A0A1F6Y2V5_9BACT|nr:MAG: hypothetical protein A3E95_00845 [Candidatus Nomurabacteria bacterium RIFCSPHIGHO2_12_FULL_44_22b]OGJ00713.1 MAG: hypothetical protein A3G53_00740 [Candidatus Nomurabacteria bacterium RIFCSPLOWO2_12_FULL_44_11]OGJ06928.1 MAG: hypothetical protein A3I95_00840 [Candidatus Nomurabacteria bacterium RIFCSPLOWO2_02_FULL_44_12]
MKTSAISVKIDPKVKHAAQKVANELGFSLSDVVNASLKNLVRSKTISYSLLEPSPLLKRAIKASQREQERGELFGPFGNVKDLMKSLES